MIWNQYESKFLGRSQKYNRFGYILVIRELFYNRAYNILLNDALIIYTINTTTFYFKMATTHF